MKKSIKNLEVKSIKNIKAVKGGEDNLGDNAKALEYVRRLDAEE